MYTQINTNFFNYGMIFAALYYAQYK